MFINHKLQIMYGSNFDCFTLPNFSFSHVLVVSFYFCLINLLETVKSLNLSFYWIRSLLRRYKWKFFVLFLRDGYFLFIFHVVLFLFWDPLTDSFTTCNTKYYIIKNIIDFIKDLEIKSCGFYQWVNYRS